MSHPFRPLYIEITAAELAAGREANRRLRAGERLRDHAERLRRMMRVAHRTSSAEHPTHHQLWHPASSTMTATERALLLDYPTCGVDPGEPCQATHAKHGLLWRPTHQAPAPRSLP